jgi:transcriptional regulator of acetoin/glycerol metabolism
MDDTKTLSSDSALRETEDVVQPQLLLVVERSRPAAGGAYHSLAKINRVTMGRSSVRSARRTHQDGMSTLEIGVPDTRISAAHATLERRGDDWILTDCGSTNGTRVRGEPITRARLADGDIFQLAGTFFLFRSAASTPVAMPGDMDSTEVGGLAAAFGTLIPRLIRDLEQLAKIARSDVSVLLIGESGVGKEVLARAIHQESARKGPFVAVNCGALPTPLVESLLFGHKKGAFSGATRDELGFVRAAEGGTLLLDEVGDLNLSAQASLLRVLQEREVSPIGSTRSVRVDVRVLAATHRPLTALAARAEFRPDLLARLAGLTFNLPPLRSRMEDLGRLIAAILRNQCGEDAARYEFGVGAMRSLLAHSWPNNVRELAQCIAVGRALAIGHRIEQVNLTTSRPEAPTPLSAKDEALRAEIVAKLKEHGGNVTRAAQAMGKARSQMQRWLGRFGLDPRDYRPPER